MEEVVDKTLLPAQHGGSKSEKQSSNKLEKPPDKEESSSGCAC